MSTVLIGIDPSSKKIAAVITEDEQPPVVWTRSLPDPASIDIKADWAERLVRRLVLPYIAKGARVVVFVEDPVVGRGGPHATIVQATTRGGILVGLRRAGVREVHGANNQRWKKVVVGRGSANKTDIKRHIMQTWPYVYDLAEGDEDVCDAAGINLYGQKVVELEERIKNNKEKES